MCCLKNKGENMRKLGLCVRYDCNNYGSMLQIFATQSVIKKMGWEYEIIRYDKKTLGFILKNISRLFNPYFMRGKIMDFRKKKIIEKYPDIKLEEAKRLSCFGKYREQYIGPYSPVFKGYSALKKGTDRYDAVMVGSDQLWTPAGIKSKFYNLIFVPDHKRKISFATSFGVAEVPKNQAKETAFYLNRIEFLSVRETAGAEIVKKLTERAATIALDPTLLFTGEEWREIFPEEKLSEDEYIFAYFLGTNPKHREVVEKLSKQTGLKIVTCPHLDDFVKGDLNFGDEQKFEVGPVEFLNLIRGAKYVCTDSFHGSIFSILNHKLFITFNRYEDDTHSRNSRIDSLLGLLGLECRRYSDNESDLLVKLERKIAYQAVETKLAQLREESFEFLRRALI